MSKYFAPARGDVVVLTCELPPWARSKKQHSVIATELCALAQILRIAPWDEERVGWFFAEILIFDKVHTTICVFVTGTLALPEPEAKPELDLENLLKEEGNGKADRPPTPPPE